MSDTTQLPPLPGPDSKTPEATTPPKTPLSGQPAEPATTGDATMTPHDATSSEGDEAAPAEPPAPATFAELGVPAHLLRAIEKLGWTRPTEVQARAFTPGVEGKDLMVQSRTGSGKTGAFCLPWIASRFEPGDAKDTGVQLLVLLPTRELARQVCDQLVSLCDESEISVLPVYGGTAMNPQLDALARGVHAVVGTPGRILDHIRRRSLVLDKVRTVVLDECDEMLSMGFLEDIRSILERCPRERQTCLFSATVPPDISRIARRSMRDPIRLELSTDGISAAEIQHVYYSTSGSTIKTRALQDVIMVEDPSSAIVFCNTREETRIVANVLRKDGYTAEALSSDLTQAAREHVMKLMRERKLRFLVATDVAARGIDISHVSHVINYSFPENAESYVHRTGRTGRAGRKGKAVSIVSAQEIGSFYMLTKQYADITFEEQQLPDGDELSARRRQTKIDGITHRFSELVSADWTVLARDLMGDPRGEQVMALLLSDALSKSPSRDTQEAATDDQIAAREETQARRARRDGGSGRGRVRRRDRDAGEGERARAERPRRPTRDDEDGVTHSVTVEDEQPRQRADTTDGAVQEEDRPGRRRRRRRRGPSRGADEQAT
ncbi:MAG: DEAD/DEAH box helicase, partial [Nannocystaceae bacterium]